MYICLVLLESEEVAGALETRVVMVVTHVVGAENQT